MKEARLLNSLGGKSATDLSGSFRALWGRLVGTASVADGGDRAYRKPWIHRGESESRHAQMKAFLCLPSRRRFTARGAAVMLALCGSSRQRVPVRAEIAHVTISERCLPRTSPKRCVRPLLASNNILSHVHPREAQWAYSSS